MVDPWVDERIVELKIWVHNQAEQESEHPKFVG